MTLNSVQSKCNPLTALYLMFRIEADYYALAATRIEFVLSRQRLKQIPGAPTWMVGLLNIDDKVIPVIDIYQRLLGKPASVQASTRLVIVRYQEDKWLGLLLEKVNTFERLSLSAWTDGTVKLHNNNFLAAVQQHERLGLIQNIELDLLLPDDVRQQLFQQDRLLVNTGANETRTNTMP